MIFRQRYYIVTFNISGKKIYLHNSPDKKGSHVWRAYKEEAIKTTRKRAEKLIKENKNIQTITYLDIEKV